MGPYNRLHGVATIASDCAARWSSYEHTEALLGLPSMRSGGFDAPIAGSDVSRPVESIVVSHERYHDTVRLVEEAMQAIRRVDVAMASVLAHKPGLNAEGTKRLFRCIGWGDREATCVEVVHKDGLCCSCYFKRRRAEQKADSAA